MLREIADHHAVDDGEAAFGDLELRLARQVVALILLQRIVEEDERGLRRADLLEAVDQCVGVELAVEADDAERRLCRPRSEGGERMRVVAPPPCGFFEKRLVVFRLADGRKRLYGGNGEAESAQQLSDHVALIRTAEFRPCIEKRLAAARLLVASVQMQKGGQCAVRTVHLVVAALIEAQEVPQFVGLQGFERRVVRILAEAVQHIFGDGIVFDVNHAANLLDLRRAALALLFVSCGRQSRLQLVQFGSKSLAAMLRIVVDLLLERLDDGREKAVVKVFPAAHEPGFHRLKDLFLLVLDGRFDLPVALRKLQALDEFLLHALGMGDDAVRLHAFDHGTHLGRGRISRRIEIRDDEPGRAEVVAPIENLLQAHGEGGLFRCKMLLDAPQGEETFEVADALRDARQKVLVEKHVRCPQEVGVEEALLLLVVVTAQTAHDLADRTGNDLPFPRGKICLLDGLLRLFQLFEEPPVHLAVGGQAAVRLVNAERVRALHPLRQQDGDLFEALLQGTAKRADKLGRAPLYEDEAARPVPAVVNQAIDLVRADILHFKMGSALFCIFQKRLCDIVADEVKHLPFPLGNGMQGVGEVAVGSEHQLLRLDEAAVAAVFRNMTANERVLVFPGFPLQLLDALFHTALVLEPVVSILVRAALRFRLELHEDVERVAEPCRFLEQVETLRRAEEALHPVVIRRMIEIEVPEHGGDGQSFMRFSHALREIDVRENVGGVADLLQRCKKRVGKLLIQLLPRIRREVRRRMDVRRGAGEIAAF